MRQLAFALTLLLTTLPTHLQAGEVGYDTTLGEVHAAVTFGYNQTQDPEYAGFPGQISQRVIPGSEALELLDPTGFTGEELEYLAAILSAEHAKVILLEGSSEEETSLYVPIPSHTEPFVALPDTLQYKVGVWSHGVGQGGPECDYRHVESGQTGSSVNCHCSMHLVRCCSGSESPACHSHSQCGYCHEDNGVVAQLEEQFGPDPRWTRVRPFAQLEPGQRLEVEATLPD